ncbi:MAG TPA: hypothetical protein VGB53_06860 [Rubricoccaceae bacterium]|jgi:single-stranded-DNA-specific exonuclease
MEPSDDRIEASLVPFRAFLDARPEGGHTVVLCHFDADGLAAGALFGRGLPLLGAGRVTVVPSGRDESAFSDAARDRLRALRPDALVVTDLGVSESGTLEADGTPVLYVDHHRPSGLPAGGLVVSGYDWDPVPCSAELAYALLEAVVPDVDEMRTLDWIAAIGVLSDLGDNAPWLPLADTKRRHTAKWLKEATVLVNAARRGATFRADAALALLMELDGPRDLAEAPEAEPLRAARKEVADAMAVARKRAPVFSTRDAAVPPDARPAADLRFALVTVHSPCQIHPLIAQQWRTRLPDYAVVCANTGYLPGTIAFSTRTARTDVVLPALYRAIDTPGWNGRWGHGHDQASGGHLPPAVFNEVLDALGFEATAHLAVPA